LFGDDVDEEIKRIDKTKNLWKNLGAYNKEGSKSFSGSGFRKFNLRIFHEIKFTPFDDI
jgi:hypothetical protein